MFCINRWYERSHRYLGTRNENSLFCTIHPVCLHFKSIEDNNITCVRRVYTIHSANNTGEKGRSRQNKNKNKIIIKYNIICVF